MILKIYFIHKPKLSVLTHSKEKDYKKNFIENPRKKHSEFLSDFYF